MRSRLDAERKLGLIAFFAVGCLVVIGACVPFCGGFGEGYSTGSRSGMLQKFTVKGVVVKCGEGELRLYDAAVINGGKEGLPDNIWAFSVTDPQLQKRLENSTGQRLRLHYRQYMIPPFQMGTSYLVTEVESEPEGNAHASAH